MKSTYAAPAATTCGDVVRSTLSVKVIGPGDVVTPVTMASGGAALSFGL